MVGTLHRIQRRKLYKGNVLYFPPTQNKIFSLCHICFGNYFGEDLLNVFTQPRNQFCTLEKSVVAGDLLGSLKLQDHFPIIWMICISNDKINGKSCCWTVLLSFFTCIIHLRHTDMTDNDAGLLPPCIPPCLRAHVQCAFDADSKKINRFHLSQHWQVWAQLQLAICLFVQD